ncbi:hypothetical protein V6N11_082826 [Hibiscus sabdariffa]|uniref:Uncharacterized protein n=1 Tax=Hibiscus sabdariffa TaxID=183260 RepID=A0ABR2QK80_9ROSI
MFVGLKTETLPLHPNTTQFCSHGSDRLHSKREIPSRATMAKQRRQCMAVDSFHTGRDSEHARTRNPLRQHRQEEMGRQLRLHGSLRLCPRPHLLGPFMLPHGLRR